MTVEQITKAQASEYDFYLLIDKSGSMGSPSKRLQGKDRWYEAKEHAMGIASFLKDVDEDGFTLITFSGSINVTDNVKDTTDVDRIFSTQTPGGSTALHLALDAVQAKRERSSKPIMVLVVTDGEPSDKQAAEQSIARMVRATKRDADLAIQFLQIGDDSEASAFLQRLDDDLKTAHKLEFDCVNTMTAAESEKYDILQVLHLALND